LLKQIINMAKKKNKNSNIISEQNVDYSHNRIKIFNSLTEENEFTYSQMAKFSGTENLTNVTSLICKIYKNELETNPTAGNRIYFI